MIQDSGTRWIMPADTGLISALGRAIYNFAQLELCVDHVWRKLCGAIDGRIGNLPLEDVAGALEGDIGALPWEGELVAKLLHVMRRYRDLKPRRDRLLCLPRHGSEAWAAPEILAVAHAFEVAAIEANQMLRRYF